MSNERRNFLLVLLVAASSCWLLWCWLFMNADTGTLVWGQRSASTLLAASTTIWLVYALKFADKLPNYLGETVGSVYYEADGISFLPILRMHQGHAELCIYYQNRYENLVTAIVHLRPLDEQFEICTGCRDVHFAFRADGGDFGVIHQPITVPDELLGEVLEFHLAAGSYYPRSHGQRLRKEAGMTCGSLLVDWGGAAFRTGVHEVSGAVELLDPTPVHMSLPNIPPEPIATDTWRQERIHAGSAEM